MYDDYPDFIASVDEEGLHYFFCDYTSAEDVTVAGDQLPAGIIEAARDMAEATARLRRELKPLRLIK